jgi:hypothetical protein
MNTTARSDLMEPIDYGSSFLRCKWPENSVRFWIESRTRFVDEASGLVEDYYQCAACKSENTFAKSDLFQSDNWDFTPIFGPKLGVIFRRKAWLNPNYKSIVPVDKMWDGPIYDLVRAPRSCRELALSDPKAIADATDTGVPIIAQVEVRNAQTLQRAIFEHPVKTLNIHRQKGLFQTDTGPVAFIDLAQRVEQAADAIALAFIAFNTQGFADFVIEAPASAHADGKSQPMVNHFSKIVSLPAVNRLWALNG